MTRWARDHERLFISLFMAVVIAAAVGAGVDAWGDADGETRLAIVLAWAIPFAGLALYELLLWRRGRLLVTDPEERAIARERNARQARIWIWPAVGLAVVLGVLGGQPQAIVLGMFGGAILAMAPVLLYVAFVLRPDQRVGGKLAP
jgi:hypothetical protein